MRKSLLLCAFALSSLVASADDGLVTVGANITVLPSSKYSGNVEWKAWTWVYNTGANYGEPNNESNPNYNNVWGEPSMDAADHMWYEPEYNMAEIKDENFDKVDEETGEYVSIVWEEHTAPFSTDENWGGRPSYRWTTNNIMADVYVRRTFTTDQLLSGPVYLACGHDDAPSEFYINGELVHSISDGWNDSEFILLSDEQKSLIKLGGQENVIAFHVHQNWGGAFADCGLYTKVEGGLEMGYVTPWEGKVLFNNKGGYNNDDKSPSNNPKSPWSKLYVAEEGDAYSFTMPGSSEEGEIWQEQLHFKTPIKIEEGKAYSFNCKLEAADSTGAPVDFSAVVVKLTDNDFDDIELAYEDVVIEDGAAEVAIDFAGQDVNNFCIAFDFGGGKEGANMTISEISLVDADAEKDLWAGTSYFNYIYMMKQDIKYYTVEEVYNEELEEYEEKIVYLDPEKDDIADAEIEMNYVQVDAPEITGRTETLSWTLPDFDDSMWDDMMMPVGHKGYMKEVQTNWPGYGPNYYYEGDGGEGHNTNFWIRRDFELEKVNERLSYALNVCHDDVYETYVNGHLLQKNVGWTGGKNPVQVHIPAKYLNAGKNVIATYIQQNWGGRFYDCGINVEEVNYDECAAQLKAAIAYAEDMPMLTNKMKANVQALIDEAKNELATNKDAAEIKNYAKEFKDAVNGIFGYSGDVKILHDTYDICRKMEDKGYWQNTLVNAAIALDTCQTASQLTPALDALRVARKAAALERHTEKYIGCAPQAVEAAEVGDFEGVAPKYYIYNVGEKMFLGAGESWGTHLALEYLSNPMMLVKVEDEDGAVIEGRYRIETFRANGDIGDADFMGWNGYIDCRTNDAWEIIPVEGKENVYNIAQAGKVREDGTRNLLGLRTGTENAYARSEYVVDTDMKTAELESNQWMFITREEMLALVPTASVDNPIDLSFLITNPGYDQRLDIGAWMFQNDGGNVQVWGRNDNHSNFLFESWNSDYFSMTQDLWPDEYDAALPAGQYTLSVQGYYRDGSEQVHVNKFIEGKEPLAQRAIIMVGADLTDPESCTTMPLMPITIEANQVPGIGWLDDTKQYRMPGQGSGCGQAAEWYFTNGLYWNRMAFTIEEGNEGYLSLGILKDYVEDRPQGDWCLVDNWRIKYYGTDAVDEDAIQTVASDKKSADNSVYNLLGQKLSQLKKGVNIIGGKKVILK